MNLDEYIHSGVVFFDKPEDLAESIDKPVKNPRLEKGEFFPLFYDSNPKTLKLLDLLVEKIKPSVVVETGFGNGMSAKAILSAFKKYDLKDSKLYSFDINSIITSSEVMKDPQFNLILIKARRDFIKKMEEIGQIDMFYHDSDHSYNNQMIEYDLAWKMLRKGGVLATDDTHLSEAFQFFCRKERKTPLLLCDNGKYSGAIQK